MFTDSPAGITVLCLTWQPIADQKIGPLAAHAWDIVTDHYSAEGKNSHFRWKESLGMIPVLLRVMRDVLLDSGREHKAVPLSSRGKQGKACL